MCAVNVDDMFISACDRHEKLALYLHMLTTFAQTTSFCETFCKFFFFQIRTFSTKIKKMSDFFHGL